MVLHHQNCRAFLLAEQELGFCCDISRESLILLAGPFESGKEGISEDGHTIVRPIGLI